MFYWVHPWNGMLNWTYSSHRGKQQLPELLNSGHIPSLTLTGSIWRIPGEWTAILALQRIKWYAFSSEPITKFIRMRCYSRTCKANLIYFIYLFEKILMKFSAVWFLKSFDNGIFAQLCGNILFMDNLFIVALWWHKKNGGTDLSREKKTHSSYPWLELNNAIFGLGSSECFP